MKRTLVLGFTFFASLASAQPDGVPVGPPTIDVKVVDPLPLPITGTINGTVDANVVNTPDVNVANTPDVRVANVVEFERLVRVELYAEGDGQGDDFALSPGRILSSEMRYICEPNYSIGLPQNSELYVILQGSGGTINRVTLSRFLSGPGVSGVVAHDYSAPIELSFDESAGETANAVLLLPLAANGCFASASLLYERL